MSNRNYGLVRNEEQLTRFVDKLVSDAKPFGFDVETGYSGPLRSKGSLQHYAPDGILAGFSFTNNPDWARYVAISHDGAENLDTQHVARELWRLLNTGLGVAHNALMELSRLSKFFRDTLWDDEHLGAEVRESDGLFPIHADTMLESMLLVENKKKDLKTLTKEILGIDQAELISLFQARPTLKGQNPAGKWVKYNRENLRFNVLPLDDDVVSYACEDSAVALEHYYRTHPQISDTLICKTEHRLTPILVQMEKTGLYLDWAEYERRSVEIERFRDRWAEYVMDQFSEISGEIININLNSHPQVRNVLFNKMGLTPTEYTKDTNVASTGEKAMRLLVAKHPEIKSLLQYREIAKLLGSYINKYLKELRYDPTGYAHPSHKQEGAGTGRFSVDGVSYQQWPKPYHYELPTGESLDLNYRNFLISPPDHRIVGFDYANVELRIVASLAQEHAMIEAFANGVDIHKQTASLMLKVPLEEVTDKQRSVGKTLNFAIVYGSGADNIASLITAATGEHCSVEQAEHYLQQYFVAFPGLKAWMDDRILEARTVRETTVPGQAKHYITTVFGRRIPIFEYESPYRSIRNKGDRNAVNAPVQGAAADYMKIGMVRVDAAIKRAEAEGVIPKGSVRLIMTIHDALEFYVHKDVSTQTVIDIIGPAVSYRVDSHMPNHVEIRADWHEGYRWGSVAELEFEDDGRITYHRKLELPDKSKHTFSDDTLDGLVEQIEAFWAERNSTELDAKTVSSEVEFEFDSEEDEFYVRDIPVAIDPSPAHPEKLVEEPMLEPEPRPEVSMKLKLILDAMPTTVTWPLFQNFLKGRPGTSTLVVSTPRGELTLEDVGILPDDEAEIRLIFGAASLRVEDNEDVAHHVLEGIAL